MGKFILKTQIRDIFGKKNQALRKQGLIPGIVYGRKTKPLALKIDFKKFLDIYQQAGETDLIDLIIEEGDKEQTKNVLVQAVAKDYVSSQPLHVDFYEVEMDKPVTTHIPLIFVNEAPATKMGGILIKSMDEIEIEALPKDLPHSIEVDISSLDEFDKTLYIRDIEPPEGVKFLVKENTPVITVSAPITEEELEVELGKAKTVEEVVVEGEKKEEKVEEETKKVPAEVRPEEKTEEKKVNK